MSHCQGSFSPWKKQYGLAALIFSENLFKLLLSKAWLDCLNLSKDGSMGLLGCERASFSSHYSATAVPTRRQ
jgi:hypothetical protein